MTPPDDHGFEVIEPPPPPRRARVVERPVAPPAPRKRWARVLRAAAAVAAVAALGLLAAVAFVAYGVYDYRQRSAASKDKWRSADGVLHDWKIDGPPPGMSAWQDPSLTPSERYRLMQQGAAAKQSVKDRAEAEQFRAVISAVRRDGRNLEIDYEFTKGFDILDGPNGHRVGFVVSQGGSKGVYVATLGELTQAGTLSLKDQSLFGSDARVEVQIVLLDTFQEPKAMISNPAQAK